MVVKSNFFAFHRENPLKYVVELNESHILFKAHFPNYPILPGSCVAEIIRTTASDSIGREMRIIQVNKMKFIRPILPDGRELEIEMEIKETGEGDGKEEEVIVKAKILKEGEIYSDVQIKLAEDNDGMEAKENECENEWVRRNMNERKITLLIPTYNNCNTVEGVIEEALKYSDNIIVVNDGSTDQTKAILSRWKGKITEVSYEKNRGKGYAIKQGFRKAKEMGYEAVITLDSDGQHKLSDLPIFIEANEKNPSALVIGSRQLNLPNMPSKNTFANKFSNFWFMVQTFQKLPDTQTGYRLYPIKSLGYIVPFNKRYEAELELLVRCAWRCVPLLPIPIHVYYPPAEERVSHFRPGMDFFRISVLNTILCFLAVVYGYPSMAVRKIIKKLGTKGE